MQDREAAMLKSHTLQEQPIEDCLSTLGSLLAGTSHTVPPVTTVFAQPPPEGVHIARSKQACPAYVL